MSKCEHPECLFGYHVTDQVGPVRSLRWAANATDDRRCPLAPRFVGHAQHCAVSSEEHCVCGAERRADLLDALHAMYRDRPAGVTLNEIDIHIRSAKAGDLAEALAFVEEHGGDDGDH